MDSDKETTEKNIEGRIAIIEGWLHGWEDCLKFKTASPGDFEFYRKRIASCKKMLDRLETLWLEAACQSERIA